MRNYIKGLWESRHVTLGDRRSMSLSMLRKKHEERGSRRHRVSY